MQDIGSWRGRLAGRRNTDNLRDVVPLHTWVPGSSPGQGESQPRLAHAPNGLDYWVKVIGNPQHEMVPVNEQIVGRLGSLIGAPTCQVDLVNVTDAMAESIQDPGFKAGIAHGSLHVKTATHEVRTLSLRQRDDNATRHAAIVALVDWCFGFDHQWLVAGLSDQEFYSHDHGNFFPYGYTWSENLESLPSVLHEPPRLPRRFSPVGLNPAELERCAGFLEGIDPQLLVSVLSAVPQDWPVSNCELEHLGWFLEKRAPSSADRLRGMAIQLS